MQLNGKCIAITGGTGGIGKPLCALLRAEGAELIVISHQAETLPFPAELVAGDLSSVAGIEAIAAQLATRHIDVLVNLAGIQFFGPLAQQQPAHAAATYHVNLLAPVLLAQAVLPQMQRRNEGHIVNVGSIFASIPFAHFITYSSAKAGLKAFSEALRREVAASNIGVTYIAPRAVNTPLNSEKVRRFGELTKMQMDTPEEVAKRIVEALTARRKDVYIGFPEGIFVRLNALFPRLVDKALHKNDRLAERLFTSDSIH